MNIKQLKKTIEKDWGKKCKDFSCTCVICQAWLAYAIFEDLYDAVAFEKHLKPKKGIKK